MNYRVVHRTEYNYSEPASLCYNEARLQPRHSPRQRCLRSVLAVDPAPVDYRERVDFFGNRVAYFAIQQPYEKLVVTATSEVALSEEQEAFVFGSDVPWEQVRDQLRSDRAPELLAALAYAQDSPIIVTDGEMADYAGDSFQAGRPLVEAVEDLMGRIHRDFRYSPGVTTVATPLSEVIAHRRGVCQDFAHFAIGCLRAQGLAARYVSGYLETLPPPGQEKLVGADASHAWFAVFLPGSGWVDFDPTNNLRPTQRHITIGWGRDFADVTPLKGVAFGGGKQKLKVSVDVQPLGGEFEF
ncbi:transglutaminase family protein [Desulfuromonas carbonis]|uniref:transglutaminase family protein n=1 Tax=Desulfuromonas sp. DDH964 TaxID=1823759 RepID=UPI00078C2117|nr:transglutaminase family protein [Desulfuromonas sp. DDH964]AMV72743.1 transglutaminase [Desulfuromonas sp. DDH964]